MNNSRNDKHPFSIFMEPDQHAEETKPSFQHDREREIWHSHKKPYHGHLIDGHFYSHDYLQAKRENEDEEYNELERHQLHQPMEDEEFDRIFQEFLKEKQELEAYHAGKHS